MVVEDQPRGDCGLILATSAKLVTLQRASRCRGRCGGGSHILRQMRRRMLARCLCRFRKLVRASSDGRVGQVGQLGYSARSIALSVAGGGRSSHKAGRTVAGQKLLRCFACMEMLQRKIRFAPRECMRRCCCWSREIEAQGFEKFGVRRGYSQASVECDRPNGDGGIGFRPRLSAGVWQGAAEWRCERIRLGASSGVSSRPSGVLIPHRRQRTGDEELRLR